MGEGGEFPKFQEIWVANKLKWDAKNRKFGN